MKRYLLFVGKVYYPGEGIDDLINDFDDLREAELATIEVLKKEDCFLDYEDSEIYNEMFYFQIYDTHTKIVVRNDFGRLFKRLNLRIIIKA